LVLLLRPDLEEKEQKKVLEKLKKIIEAKKGARVAKVDPWGKRTLAYEIKKSRQGIYYLLTLQATSKIFPELEKEMKLDENIIRYLIVKG
jgi:small subunit ribosomal protein S6